MTAPHITATSFSPRVAPNLRHAFGGIWRLTLARFFTVGHGLALAGALALLGLIAFAFISGHNHERGYVGWAANFYVAFLVPVVAFIAGTGAVRDDMKPATVDYALTRPVPRPAFVIFRYLSHVAASQVEFLLAASVIVILGAWRHVPDIGAAVPRMLVGQILLVFAFSAFGFLCGAITSRAIVIGLIYGAIVEIGVGQIPTQLNRLSMTHQVKAMLESVLPAGASLNGTTDTLPAAGIAATSAILLAFTAVCVVGTAAIFSLRELSSANES